MHKGAIIKRKQIRNLLLFIIALIVLNILSAKLTFRIDMTRDHRFTLTEPTRNLLRNLEGEVKVKVFLKGNNLPASFRHFSTAIQDVLADFRHYSNGQVQFQFVNPLTNLSDTSKARVIDSLAALGIRPYNVKAQQEGTEGVSMQMLFPAALIDYKGHKLGINLLAPQPGSNPEQSLNHSASLLEFHLIYAIARLAEGTPRKVAYLLGNGETLNPSVYDALTILDRNYHFDTLNLKNINHIPTLYEAIVVLDPNLPFNKKGKLLIDQYLMQGGKILWAIHSVQASMDSLKQQSSFLAYDRSLNLENLLFTYGVRINPDILQDLQCFSIPVTIGHIGNRPQIKRLPWVYEPLLSPVSSHPITHNLDLVLSAFPGSIDTTKLADIRKTVLLRTSSNSRSIGTPYRVSMEDVKTKPNPSTFGKSHLPVAVLLEGQFTSVFKNRLNHTELSNIKMHSGKDYRSESIPTKMIVVSDPNIFKNAISQKDGPLPMGMDAYTRERFANRSFFKNCLTYLTDTTGVMIARNKEFSIRLMDQAKVEQQKGKWQVLNFLIPFLFVLLFGILFQYFRKRKYTQ